MTKRILELKNKILALETSTAPGHVQDGAEIRVTIGFVKKAPTAQALRESETARRHGLDLKTFTGHLDRVFFSSKNELCLTLLALERVSMDGAAGPCRHGQRFYCGACRVATGRHPHETRGARYCYRTFNVDSGQVRGLRVLRRPARLPRACRAPRGWERPPRPAGRAPGGFLGRAGREEPRFYWGFQCD